MNTSRKTKVCLSINRDSFVKTWKDVININIVFSRNRYCTIIVNQAYDFAEHETPGHISVVELKKSYNHLSKPFLSVWSFLLFVYQQYQ